MIVLLQVAWASIGQASDTDKPFAVQDIYDSSGKTKRGLRPVCCTASCGGSLLLDTVIHFELDRMRGHAQTSHFIHLQRDEGIDKVVGEYTATGQELAILVQVCQR